MWGGQGNTITVTDLLFPNDKTSTKNKKQNNKKTKPSYEQNKSAFYTAHAYLANKLEVRKV